MGSKDERMVAVDEETYQNHLDVKAGRIYGLKPDPDMDRYRRMNPEDYRPKGFWSWLTGG